MRRPNLTRVLIAHDAIDTRVQSELASSIVPRGTSFRQAADSGYSPFRRLDALKIVSLQLARFP